jgi:hypothetical protein
MDDEEYEDFVASELRGRRPRSPIPLWARVVAVLLAISMVAGLIAFFLR